MNSYQCFIFFKLALLPSYTTHSTPPTIERQKLFAEDITSGSNRRRKIREQAATTPSTSCASAKRDHHLFIEIFLSMSSSLFFSTFEVSRQAFYRSSFSYAIVNLKPIVPGRMSRSCLLELTQISLHFQMFLLYLLALSLESPTSMVPKSLDIFVCHSSDWKFHSIGISIPHA